MALIARRPTTTHLPAPASASHVVIIRDLTILVLWRAALMLAMQVGRQPCLLRTPQLGCSGQFSCLVALRVLFLTRAIWISDYSADARRCSGLLTAVEQLRCCVFGAVYTLLASFLNHLRWGVLVDSDLLWTPGSAKLTKGSSEMALPSARFVSDSYAIICE